MKENAWFCGENFDYFEALFLQLPFYINENTFCYMILSEDCQIEKIKEIAAKNKLKFLQVFEKKQNFEWNFIFKIVNLS